MSVCEGNVVVGALYGCSYVDFRSVTISTGICFVVVFTCVTGFGSVTSSIRNPYLNFLLCVC